MTEVTKVTVEKDNFSSREPTRIDDLAYIDFRALVAETFEPLAEGA